MWLTYFNRLCSFLYKFLLSYSLIGEGTDWLIVLISGLFEMCNENVSYVLIQFLILAIDWVNDWNANWYIKKSTNTLLIIYL